MSVGLLDEGLLDDVREGITMNLAPLNIEQYHQMIRDGILHDGEPIELIHGVLLFKDRRDQSGGIMTHGARHLRALKKLTALLTRWAEGKSCHLQAQGPITVSGTSEPEPDCCLVRGTPDDYADEVPRADDVLVVFEVAYSSLRSDRRTKQRLYASAGIPFYVILNLQDDVIEVLSEPSTTESRYTAQFERRDAEAVDLSLGEHGQLSFTVEDLF
ncbi:MAG: Uma2 family endonuclease [Planctomycetota bacterium]